MELTCLPACLPAPLELTRGALRTAAPVIALVGRPPPATARPSGVPAALCTVTVHSGPDESQFEELFQQTERGSEGHASTALRWASAAGRRGVSALLVDDAEEEAEAAPAREEFGG
jgi:hypothetical protein